MSNDKKRERNGVFLKKILRSHFDTKFVIKLTRYQSVKPFQYSLAAQMLEASS